MHFVKLSDTYGINLSHVLEWTDYPTGSEPLIVLVTAAASENEYGQRTPHVIRLMGPNLAKPQKLAKSTLGDSPTGLEYAPKVRFSCLTTRFASIPPLLRRGLSRQYSQNFAVYPLCVLFGHSEKYFMRSGPYNRQISRCFS
jgi:hypothetical protein